jgi:hypothetical protein
MGDAAVAFGLEPGGAVLVRPDGVVAWRTAAMPSDPRSALAQAVSAALGRPNHPTSIEKEAA